MKKNYFESILGFFTLMISLVFLLKFVNVNTDNNETYQLKAKFLKAGGISPGNDVKMRGVKIGVVNQVYLDEDFFAVVDFKIYTHISVPNDSKVNIASDGILGNKYLSISPNGAPHVVLCPAIAEFPGMPGIGVLGKCPGPLLRD